MIVRPSARASPAGLVLHLQLPRQRLPGSRRGLIAAPRAGSGPLLERRADRALPSVGRGGGVWVRTLPVFAGVVGAAAAAMFNYQKTCSPVVQAALYGLRTNGRARELLGDEIGFASAVPWIAGPLDQVHGRIDVRFWVKGTRGRGRVRFRSERRTRMGVFETLEWSLQPEGQETISLLPREGTDPFRRE